MVSVLERLSRFYMCESCGQCTPCREGTGWLNRMLKRILAGQGRREDIDLLVQVANKIEGHTICALGDAAAWPVQSFVKHFRHEFEYMIDHGGRSIVEARGRAGADGHERRRLVNIEVDGVPMKARKGEMIIRVTDANGVYVPRFCYHEKLSDRGQLPHVPGRGGEGAQAAAGLRHAGGRGHEGLHAFAQGHRRAEGDDGIPADQPSARLPDLRPGRRVRAAGPGHGLRPRRLALHRAQARGEGQEHRSAGLHRHDALHPLHALRALRPGDRRASRSSAPPAAASTTRSAPTSRRASTTSCRATSSTCARWAR